MKRSPTARHLDKPMLHHYDVLTFHQVKHLHQRGSKLEDEGDTINAEIEVLEIHQAKPVAYLGVIIKEQDSDKVLKGEARR